MIARYLFVLITLCSIAPAQTSRSINPDFSAIRQQLRAHVGNDDVPGLAIAVSRGGESVWEEGFGWANRERRVHARATTPFYIASVTKSITATAVIHLVEQGKLQLDKPVNGYLGAAKIHSTVWDPSEVTIRRLATQTSGLNTFSRWCGSAADPGCDIDGEIERYGILTSPPGEVFDYSNLNYGILGDVIARVSGESLDSYLQSAIFRPLGMVNCTMTLSGRAAKQGATQYDQKTHVRSSSRVSGHEGASGLHCSARDLLSFGMFQLRKYSGSDSPLSDRDIQDMHLAQPGTQGQYGLGWWIGRQAGIEIISAQGGTSNAYALLELVPAKDIVVVVVANSYSQLVSRLENQILSVLLGFPVEVQSSSPQLAQASSGPDALSGKWSGQILTYQGPINVTLDIAGTGGTQIQIGDRRAALVTNSSFEPNHFYGQLRAEPGLPDSPRQTFMIELELALRGDKLIGAATFVSLPEHGGDGDQLPHFMSLARANQ